MTSLVEVVLRRISVPASTMEKHTNLDKLIEVTVKNGEYIFYVYIALFVKLICISSLPSVFLSNYIGSLIV